MNLPHSDYLDYAMINGSLMELAKVRISPLSSGFMFGEGFFETIRVEASRLELFAGHYGRLSVSLSYFTLSGLSTCAELEARCDRVIAANYLVTGSVKIMVFKDTDGWSEVIFARRSSYASEDYEKGFKLKSAPCDLRMDPVHALKSLNYLANIYARRMAQEEGFDEVVFINPHGLALEGSCTNIFMVKDGSVSTPPLGCGILPGVMRSCVLHRLDPPGFREGEITFQELLQADEVFVTNALLGIMPVVSIDDVTYDLETNVVTRSLMTALALD